MYCSQFGFIHDLFISTPYIEYGNKMCTIYYAIPHRTVSYRNHSTAYRSRPKRKVSRRTASYSPHRIASYPPKRFALFHFATYNTSKNLFIPYRFFFSWAGPVLMKLFLWFCCLGSTRRLNLEVDFCRCFWRSPGSNLRPLVYKASDFVQ